MSKVINHYGHIDKEIGDKIEPQVKSLNSFIEQIIADYELNGEEILQLYTYIGDYLKTDGLENMMRYQISYRKKQTYS